MIIIVASPFVFKVEQTKRKSEQLLNKFFNFKNKNFAKIVA